MSRKKLKCQRCKKPVSRRRVIDEVVGRFDVVRMRVCSPCYEKISAENQDFAN